MMKTSTLTKNLPTIIIATVVFMASASPLFAQTSQWAVKMFSEMGTERLHNFGSVALHANVEKRFQFKNIYDEDVVITSVSSNCGCTKATVSKQVIHPNEIGEVIAKVDTSGREHTKQRKATIRVVFSKPTAAEVQLQVKTYIRPDVGFDPGVIEFGTVQHGSKVVKKAFLQYEGRPDWALVGIQKTNPGVRAEAREVRRQGGSVVYEILVELKPEANPGYLQDLLKFQTNEQDAATSSVFLPIQGLVVEPLCAKPSFLQLGVIEPGKSVTRNLVVSGAEPFKIVGIQSEDERISSAKTDLKRSVHVLPITFTADEKTGQINSEIEITTNQEGSDGKLQKLVVSTTGIVKEEAVVSSAPIAVDEEDDADVGIVAIPRQKPSAKAVASKPKTVQRTRGLPQATEGLEPTPLNAKKGSARKSSTATKTPASEIEIQQLLEEEEALEESAVETLAEATVESEPVEFGWTPVREERDLKEKALAQNAADNAKEGGWASNWKRVRTEEKSAVREEFVSEIPDGVIVK